MKLSAISLFLTIGLANSATASTSHLRNTRRRTLISLDKNNVRGCSPDEPCAECQGDCDTDDDCAGDLICYQRDSAETAEEAIVPGCDGLSYSRTDWCVSPAIAAEDTAGDESAGEEDAADEDSAANSDVVMGFESGMSTDLVGLWVGEEKWNADGNILDYCSSAIFQPTETGNFLTWHAFQLGNETETCEDMGIDPKTGSVNNPEYFSVYNPAENYFLSVDHKACLTEADCAYDVTTSEGYEDYEVIASTCGAHLKKGIINVWYTCELYQISRIQKKDGTGEPLDVAILTYSSFEGGYANFTCPNKPTFDLEELNDDPFAAGTTRFVLQNGGASDALDWECLV